MTSPYLKPATITQCHASADGDSGGAVAGSQKAGATSDAAPLTELLIVEGKSAAQALDQVRDRRHQGIFMMQGKFPNPETARAEKLLQHDQCAALLELLKQAPDAVAANSAVYDHVVIVPDADADGLHTAMLLIALFRNYLPVWAATGRLHLFRTPLARIDDNQRDLGDVQQRYLDTAPDIRHWLAARGAAATGKITSTPAPSLTHFKGLAAINTHELASLLPYPLHLNPRCIHLDSNG